MKRLQAWLAACAVVLAACAGVACGGDDDSRPLLPRLEGTPLPTVTPINCAVASPVDLPAEFPSELAVPPNYEVAVVETAPFLKVTGRLQTPPDEIQLRPPMVLLATAIADNSPAWTFGPNQSTDTLDITFTHADGRAGRYTALPIRGCRPDQLELTYEIPWVTP